MRVRIVGPASGAVIGAVVIALSSCSSQSSQAAGSATTSASGVASVSARASASAAATSAAVAVPAGYKRVGGAAQGISVAIPASWVEVNLAKQTIENAASQLNIPGLSAATLVQDYGTLEKLHAVIAFDVASAVSSHGRSTRNINAYCTSSGVTNTGSSGVPLIEQAVKAEFGSIGSNVTQQDVEVGGVPGIETSYQLNAKNGQKIGAAQLEVLPKPDQACIVTLTYGPPQYRGNFLAVAAASAQFP